MEDEEEKYKKKAEAVTDTLNEFVRSVNIFSRSYFNNDIIAQKIFIEAIRFGIEKAKIPPPEAETPLGACESYIEVLDEVGLMPEDQFKLKKEGDAITCRIKPPCLYSAGCSYTDEEDVTPTCIRGLVFHVMIKDTVDENYHLKVKEFNPEEGCIVELTPV